MSWQEEADELARKRVLARAQGGADAVARQHKKGRLTIRERVDAMVDAGSFREVGATAGESERDEAGKLTGFTPANFVLGFGTVEGRRCVVGGEDFTLAGGSPNEAGLRKSIYAEHLACQYRVPLIRLHEGAGGSVTGPGSRKAPPAGQPVYAPPRFQSVGQAMGTVPVCTAALGAVAGLPASRLVASHFSVMTEDSLVLVAGPALVARALRKQQSKEALGGPQVHARNGVVDNLVPDEPAAFAEIRRFLSYLPENVWEPLPRGPADDPPDRRAEELIEIVPRNRRQLYDMRRVIALVFDEGTFFEIGRLYGPGLITGFGRLCGYPVGIFANDCWHLAGAMTAAGAQKTRRFIELCDTFHMPIISLVDEPGFMIGADAEQAGTIRFGTAAVLAAAGASVPWASVLVRKVHGVAAVAHFGPDAYVVAWPSAEMGALPVEGGVAVAFGRAIAQADDPATERERLEAEMLARQSPEHRAETFTIHEMIDPRDTRPILCEWIERSQPLLPHLAGPRHFAVRP